MALGRRPKPWSKQDKLERQPHRRPPTNGQLALATYPKCVTCEGKRTVDKCPTCHGIPRDPMCAICTEKPGPFTCDTCDGTGER